MRRRAAMTGCDDSRASARIRTAGLSLTRRALWPTELQRRGYQGWNRTSVLLIQSQGGMPATLLVSSAEGASRTHRPRALRSRGLPVAVTPAKCAARDLNPDPLIKSQLHNRSCSQRGLGPGCRTPGAVDWSRAGESNPVPLLGGQVH
jgi:hypothetical protein